MREDRCLPVGMFLIANTHTAPPLPPVAASTTSPSDPSAKSIGCWVCSCTEHVGSLLWGDVLHDRLARCCHNLLGTRPLGWQLINLVSCAVLEKHTTILLAAVAPLSDCGGCSWYCARMCRGECHCFLFRGLIKSLGGAVVAAVMEVVMLCMSL